MVEIFKEFTFDSAHYLPYVPETHKCHRIHGHTYRVRVVLRGSLDEKLGWVMDFGDVSQHVKPVIAMLDHQLLNELEGLENPTAEHIAIWIWNRLKPSLLLLDELWVFETPSIGCVYRGE